MTAGRSPRTIRRIDPAVGLHRLRREFQKKFVAEQCRELTARLDEAIDATFRAAHTRTSPYLSSRPTTSQPRGKEAALERALHRQWSAESCVPAVGCWRSIHSYQVNLPAKRDAEGWGEIDLLGIAEEDDLPVVIELKRGDSDETPARALVQAAAYALVLQKAWPTLRREWIEKTSPTQPMPTALSPCRLVCAAPAEYWNRWPEGDEAAVALAELREAFRSRGLPSVLVALELRPEGEYRASPVRHR